MTRELAAMTTRSFDALVRGNKPVIALLPVGSIEPHGPHLALATDTAISEGAIARAYDRFVSDGKFAPIIAPAIPYGVTEYAQNFAGAISIPAEVLTAFVRATIAALLANGCAHVCVVNNHLEPAQDAAIRAAAASFGAASASVACPLTRRWARLLGDEFRRGECHAGAYETSLVLAANPAFVDQAAAHALPDVPISLSKNIAAGITTFAAMGMHEAYAGAPRLATATDGESLLATLAEMIVTEVTEACQKGSHA